MHILIFNGEVVHDKESAQEQEEQMAEFGATNRRLIPQTIVVRFCKRKQLLRQQTTSRYQMM